MKVHSPWRCFALAACLSVLLASAAAPAHAQAPQPSPGCNVGPVTNFLAADATQPGVISLTFFGAQGASVAFFECVDNTLQPLGKRTSAPDKGTLLPDATAWDCARPSRSFVASATLPDGTVAAGAYSVRTGSCGSRFDVTAPRRVGTGQVARVRVVDRWGIGDIKPKLCISPPRGERVCSTVGFKRAVTIRTRRFRGDVGGRWRIELRILEHRVRRTVTVGSGPAPKAPPVVLATGDSTMQGVDNFLADELGDTATVRSDIRVGTGISKSNWQAIAEAQVKRHRPSVSVLSVGVNEGFAMRTPEALRVDCCGEPWKLEYIRRVKKMTRTYRREGDGRVIWLTLPLPRGGPKTQTILTANEAIVRAVDGLPGVTLLRMDLLFSANGFTEVIRYRGRDVAVRTADGIHLNVSGTAIAAKVIAEALRKK